MRFTLLVIFLVLVLTAAVGGTLVYTGVLHVQWTKHPTLAAQPPGTTAVPIAVRPMKAYATVTRADLWNPYTRAPAVDYLPLDRIPDPPLTDFRQILNRVLRRDKQPGYTFHETDFFPHGTAPGEAAGIPLGKRAMTLNAEQLSGAHTVNAGDHIDLIATQKLDLSRTKASGMIEPAGVGSSAEATLAEDAWVVSPVTLRQVPIMGSPTLSSAAPVQTRPVEEITIAVDPSEVAAVARAVGSGSTIYCVLHSGLPAAASSSKLPADAPSRAVAVEQIVGTKHDLTVVPTEAALSGGNGQDLSSAPEARP